MLCNACNALNAVVNEKNLSTPLHFAQDGVLYHSGVIFHYVGLDGQSIFWRSINDTEITDSNE